MAMMEMACLSKILASVFNFSNCLENMAQMFVVACSFPAKIQGPVVQEPVNAKLGVKVNQGLLCRFLLLRSVSTANFKLRFGSSQSQSLASDKTNLEESSPLSYKTEFKTDANPGLAYLCF